jgi:hypothetical protein
VVFLNEEMNAESEEETNFSLDAKGEVAPDKFDEMTKSLMEHGPSLTATTEDTYTDKDGRTQIPVRCLEAIHAKQAKADPCQTSKGIK